MKKRILSALLTLGMVLTMLPVSVFATDYNGDDVDDVAYIPNETGTGPDSTYYPTLDAAIEAASDGDTIYLLDDCTVSKTLNKAITIDGGKTETSAGYTVTSTDVRYGFTVEEDTDGTVDNRNENGITKELRFQNVNLEFAYTKEVENPTYSSDLGLFYINGRTNDGNGNLANLIQNDYFNFAFVNSTVRMVNTGATNRLHAIYYDCGGGTITLDNSTLIIEGFPEDAIEWGGQTNSNINVNNSTYIADGNRAGITGTWNVTIDDSDVQVINSSGNASNGAHFYISDSEVDFSKNGGHGLSAGNLIISNSTVTANQNAYYGVYSSGRFEMDSTAVLTANQNASATWSGFAGLRLYTSSTGHVAAGAKVTLNDNYRSGLWNSGTTVFEDGAELTILRNGSNEGNGGGIYNDGTLTLPNSAVIMDNTANETGGGLCNAGTVTLPEGVQLYNNHANVAGDDIYNRTDCSLSLKEVGSDWVLDDCNDVIDGWYDDSENNRWEAHSVPTHVDELVPSNYPVVGLKALKAAHGLNPIQPGDETVNWEISKSKEATNLDENYESQVTLSLPAAGYEPEIDVVFVIDDTSSTSSIFVDAAEKLLNELRSKDNLEINFGLVTFDAVARDWLAVTSNNTLSGLVSLSDDSNYEAICHAIETALTSSGEGEAKRLGGSNIEWPLEMAQDMLSEGNGTEQHVILFSDMYGYVYRGELEVDGTPYDNVPLSKSLGTYDHGQLCISPPMYDTWDEVNSGRASDDDQLDSFFRYRVDGNTSTWENYWKIFQDFSEVPGVPAHEDIPHAPQYDADLNPFVYLTPFEKSSYLTYDRILSLLEDSVQVTIVNNDFNPGDNGDTIRNIKDGMLDELEDLGVTVIQKETENGGSFDADEMQEVFTSLENKLVQLVDAGSTVEDYMGYVADDYNFDFINDPAKLSMKVGDTTYAAQRLDTDLTYGFVPNSAGGYDYELTYVPGSKTSDEHFVWTTNVPITKDAKVQLTYFVKLVNPKTAPGTYGDYDADGSEEYGGLYTNSKAILNPVDSNGVAGLPEEFPKPTVSYTVNEPAPETGSLTISKTVNGTADTQILSEKFDFTVTFSDGGTYPYFFTQGSIESGTITSGETIQLTNGETVSINGIPDGVTYIVAETADEDFTTTVENSDGPALVTTYSEEMIQAQGTISGGIASIAHFVNTYTGEGPGTVSITPADITIYTGGDGYDSVVNGSGNEIGTTNNGLPTPGFYIELPHEVDQALKEAVGAPLDRPLDLSKYLTFTYDDGQGNTRTWHLERYDNKEGNDSMAYNRYIYRILPAEVNDEQIPVRLQFTDSEGNFMTSDDFAVNLNELFHVYDMTIYAGDLNQQLVQAVIRVNNGTPYQYDATVESGKLTVRGVTDNDTHYTTVEDSVPENVDSVTLQVGENAKFFINGSQLEVLDPSAVKLLVDSHVPDSSNTLINSALDEFEAIPNDYDYEARYLDLVDTSNGNAYVTAKDTDLTVYWAYPEGTDENTEFHLVHYVGLDRNSNDDLANGTYTMEYYSIGNGLEATEQGIRFTVDSFSPFALFWEDDNNNGGGGSSGGGGGGGGGGSKPELNKEDHIAYVSGYPDGTVQPEGYITREEVATIFFRLLTDESRADFITEYNPYPDVASDRWSYYAITTMTNGNLMLGRTGGVFDPGANITRAEFAVVAAQFSNAQYSGPDKFTDISDHWARDYINRAANEGWIAGYPDGTFGPDRFITRAEVMALVNEVLERAPDADYMLDNMTVWPDNPKSAWYYEDVQEATNSHSYVWRNTQHTSEDWEDFISMRTFNELVRDAFNAAN